METWAIVFDTDKKEQTIIILLQFLYQKIKNLRMLFQL